MMAHVYRFDDPLGLHVDCTRVTLRDGEHFGVKGRALILGTLPHVQTIPFDEVQWFWIEES